jgi:hypothetical protein
VLGGLRESRAVLERATAGRTQQASATHLESQDASTQQLIHAASVLTEMEQRLAHLASVFETMPAARRD